MSKKIEMKCEYCGKIFLQYLSQRRSKFKFCSRQCKYEWNKTVVGYWKGKEIPLKHRLTMSKNHADVSGENNPRWKGGKRIDKTGYILIWKPTHPYADYHGYVREHRLIVEQNIGRILKPKEVVHHIDLNKQNNLLSNLMLFENDSEHHKYHYETGNHKLPPGGKKSS